MYIINYIIEENDKITKHAEKSLKLIFLYNNRIFNNCIYIFWSKLDKNDEKSIIQIYNNNMNIFPTYLKIIFKKYYNVINITKSILEYNTFIKFLYDYNYLNENIINLFRYKEKQNIDLNHIIIHSDRIKLNEKEIRKIEDIKINEKYKLIHTDYYKISEGMDNKIYKNFVYFYKELIKINSKYILITTGYLDYIRENEESQKMIKWICVQDI